MVGKSGYASGDGKAERWVCGMGRLVCDDGERVQRGTAGTMKCVGVFVETLKTVRAMGWCS